MITSISPKWAVPGGRVAVTGVDLPLSTDGPPRVLVGALDAHVVAASRSAMRFVVPAEAEGGTMAVRFDAMPGETVYLEVARSLVTGIHQVDSPAFDREGRLYVTHSGGRGTKVAVPLYRVGPDGAREPIHVDLANPTSMALGPDGAMYISSRFEGNVYRLIDGRAEIYASELGVPTGLAFASDGTLFVGDRSGTILRVSPDRKVDQYASLPPSVAAFHLAVGPDGSLYVAAPTLSTRDAIYRIDPERLVHTLYEGFGRPQGLAFDSTGALYVADASAGASGLYRLDLSRTPLEAELMLTAPMILGVAFDPQGGVILASSETIWKVDVEIGPLGR